MRRPCLSGREDRGSGRAMTAFRPAALRGCRRSVILCRVWSMLMSTSTSRAARNGKALRPPRGPPPPAASPRLVDMPLNSSPVTTTPSALRSETGRRRGQTVGRLRLLRRHRAGQCGADRALGASRRAGLQGVSLSTRGSTNSRNATEADLREAMPAIAGMPGCRCWSTPKLIGRTASSWNDRSTHAAMPATSRLGPRQWEHDAIRACPRAWPTSFGCRVHIVHLSSADALPDDCSGTRRRSAAHRGNLPALPLFSPPRTFPTATRVTSALRPSARARIAIASGVGLCEG